jgi:mycothiol system anti-sigma-R factor
MGASGMGDDCSEAIHRLYHFLDGELTPQRRSDIERHLDDCGPCLQAFDFEAELRLMISTKCREEVPETLRIRIAQAIRHEEIHFGTEQYRPDGSG